MTIYDSKKFQKLYDYKENIEDKEIKQIITELMKNYNRMYIKLKDFIQKKEESKISYKQLDKLTIENRELKERVDRYSFIIEDLKKRMKGEQKK